MLIENCKKIVQTVCGEWMEIPPIRCSVFGGCVDACTVSFGPGSYSSAPLCLPCEPE